MTQVVEVFIKTGQIIVRDRTADEQAQYDVDLAAAAAAKLAATAQAAEAQAATSAAIAHAKLLGFTNDMIGVMYPHLRSESPIVP